MPPASPPIPPVPVGIRFRMCSQAATTGAMVACTTRTPSGSGGLPQPTVIVMRTTWPCVVAFSTPSITIVRPTGLLSAASPTPPNTRRYPLSYVWSGLYVWYADTGKLQYQSSDGLFWSLTPTTSVGRPAAYYLRLNVNLIPQEIGVKEYGFALRCVGGEENRQLYQRYSD